MGSLSLAIFARRSGILGLEFRVSGLQRVSGNDFPLCKCKVCLILVAASSAERYEWFVR